MPVEEQQLELREIWTMTKGNTPHWGQGIEWIEYIKLRDKIYIGGRTSAFKDYLEEMGARWIDVKWRWELADIDLWPEIKEHISLPYTKRDLKDVRQALGGITTTKEALNMLAESKYELDDLVSEIRNILSLSSRKRLIGQMIVMAEKLVAGNLAQSTSCGIPIHNSGSC